MKKIFYILAAALIFAGCTGNDPSSKTGSIYGVITDKATGEPMKAAGVELYDNGGYNLLTKTVTGDDGHFEFDDVNSGNYQLSVTISGYEDIKYQVKVIAGKTARADMQLEKVNTGLTVQTLDATNINGNSANLNGTFVEVSEYADEYGFVYSTDINPYNSGKTITSSKANSLGSYTYSFSATASNLSKGTYYVQAYAKNYLGTTYGDVRNFQISGAPAVTTLPPTNVSVTTATLNGHIDYAGDPAYTKKGFVYSSSFPNPTVDDPVSATTNVPIDGTSADFSANIAGLTAETPYYVRAYVTNSNGTEYGKSVPFKPTAIVDYVILQSDGIMVQKYDISSGIDLDAAITLCQSSRVGGYSDWRLPTIGELQALYNQRTTIGGFSTTASGSYYWSSTTHYNYYDGYYYCLNFYNGSQTIYYYTSTNRVRAVRTLP